MPAEVKRGDPVIAKLEDSLMPAFAVIDEFGLRLTDAMRVFRRKIIREMVRKTGNQHRASLRLAVSHTWLQRVNQEGEGADPIPPQKRKQPKGEAGQ